MKMQKKKIRRITKLGIVLVTILCFAVSGAGCTEVLERILIPDLTWTGLTSEPESEPASVPIPNHAQPSQSQSGYEEPLDVHSLTYDNEIPVIHNDREFNVLVNYELAGRSTEFEFYAEDGFTIDNDLLLYRFSLPYVSTSSVMMENNREFWTVYLYYYPGARIADAYLSGDLSSLNEEETITYYTALDFVENHVNPEPNVLKKEKLIHDYICQSTLYTNPASDDMIPRHCTAVGLLLDGYANCQGYADCFDMLARMAGLTVDKQSGSAEGSLHVWNIIQIDDIWYSMDITYDDTTFFTDGSGYPAYIYFNAGKDILLSTHSIPKDNELIPISRDTDHKYYYFCDLFELTGCNNDPALAKAEIASFLEECYTSGESHVSYFIPETILDSAEIVNEIQALIPDKPTRITITTYHVKNSTYILGEPH